VERLFYQQLASRMIAGLGIDIIEVERIAAKIGKESGFRELVFSKNEIDYCESKKNKFEHYAARFAAKEAFFKALGTGWLEGTFFSEIEITNTGNGKPEMVLLGSTRKTISAMGINKISVSLSHIKTMATAVVIIEK
jgi:holo-[acyl-carrier protein] synthase